MTFKDDTDFLAKNITATPDGFVFVPHSHYSSAATFWLISVLWFAAGAACLISAITLPVIGTEIGNDAAGLILKLFISLLSAFLGLLCVAIVWGMLTVPDPLAIEWNSTSRVIRYRCILRMQEEYEYLFKYEDWLALHVEDGEGVDSHLVLWMAIRTGASVKTSGPLKSFDQPKEWHEFQLPARTLDLGRLWMHLMHRRQQNYVRFYIGSFNNNRDQEHVIALIAKTGLAYHPDPT
jgi:hypothetical protein